MDSISHRKMDSKIYYIFDSLKNSGIKYCHWKSNSHLDKSFESKCDFDLLIAREDGRKFVNFLHNFNFKKKFSTANYVYPGFEDYLFFDESSGKIFHFHVHYKLIIGKKNQKNYRIPIEKLILDTAIAHDTFPIRVILPELEFILLIIRLLLKFSFNLRAVKRVFIKGQKIPYNILEEFWHLRNSINKELFSNHCNDIFSDISWLLNAFCSKSPKEMPLYWIILTRYRLIKSLRNYQIYRGRQFITQRKIRTLSSRYNMSWLNNGGVSIAFIGVDGAGKSTTIEIIKNWLSSKLSVKTFYMGLPRGNFIWEILRLFFRIFKKLKINYLSNKFDMLRNIYNAMIKYKIFQNSERAKNQGNIVLFDRYPLKDLWDSNEPIDGPIIQNNAFWQSLERKYYEKIIPADYLFVLLTDHEDAINRKSEHKSIYKQVQIRKKNRAIFQLVKSNKNYLIPINSSRNREEVLLEIKRRIWEILTCD
jgi:thymidylate kinase